VSASIPRSLLDFLLPGGCVVCRRWIPDGDDIVCGPCRSRLSPASWPRCPRCHHPRGTGREEADDCLECRDWPEELAAARYAYVLVPPASDLVHALKYEGWRELAGVMAAPMARAARSVLGPAGPVELAVVVPVPTTARRLRERGYNQAGLLAEGLAARLHLPMVEALTRARADASQTALAPGERRENVRGAFAVDPGARARIAGRGILLVDDVLTTGATAGEAAATLARTGTERVALVTFARALPRLSARAA
jgi:ComF family protein